MQWSNDTYTASNYYLMALQFFYCIYIEYIGSDLWWRELTAIPTSKIFLHLIYSRPSLWISELQVDSFGNLRQKYILGNSCDHKTQTKRQYNNHNFSWLIILSSQLKLKKWFTKFLNRKILLSLIKIKMKWWC